MSRRNYFVYDEFGDVWNDEPLTTFNQAFQFRGMILPLLNRVTSLKIRSVERDTILDGQRGGGKTLRVQYEKFLNSDF